VFILGRGFTYQMYSATTLSVYGFASMLSSCSRRGTTPVLAVLTTAITLNPDVPRPALLEAHTLLPPAPADGRLAPRRPDLAPHRRHHHRLRHFRSINPTARSPFRAKPSLNNKLNAATKRRAETNTHCIVWTHLNLPEDEGEGRGRLGYPGGGAYR
jgi:hypothetical protein